ncbi:MAG: hypothetical protein KGJ23_04525 [Euryarchaeota archaeon]|nr:hypothetical protein [Euryarchaeota archaeon]MDE1835864.1 hypothetical protein [Euryarchaeota archaeon]MDE1882206.1 hypothetical protein [Euryarchaeota archaeon]MDE2044458.1 hypothetical protein [Thermoplasmata archaeon]
MAATLPEPLPLRSGRRRGSLTRGSLGPRARPFLVVCDDPAVERMLQRTLEALFVAPVPMAGLLDQLRASRPSSDEVIAVYVETLEQACALRCLRSYDLLPPVHVLATSRLGSRAREVLAECVRSVSFIHEETPGARRASPPYGAPPEGRGVPHPSRPARGLQGVCLSSGRTSS